MIVQLELFHGQALSHHSISIFYLYIKHAIDRIERINIDKAYVKKTTEDIWRF